MPTSSQPRPVVIIVHPSKARRESCRDIESNVSSRSGNRVAVPSWVLGDFVPPSQFDPEAEDLEPLGSTKPAVLVERNNQISKGFVWTGLSHGGAATGGPPENSEGYETIERKGAAIMTVVHNRGEPLFDGKPIYLGPAYGNGREHSRDCRVKSRWSTFQNTCFCKVRNSTEEP